MADNFGSHRQLDPHEGEDIIFCHQCENEWYRSSLDTSPPPPCAICGSEAVEMVSADDPREFHSALGPWEALFDMTRPGHNRLQDLLQTVQRNQAASMDDLDDSSTANSRNIPNGPLHHYRRNRDRDRRMALDDSDPEEADIDDIDEQELRGPGNLYMYRATTFPNGRSDNGPRRAPSGRRTGGTDPSDPIALINTFTELLSDYRPPQTGRSGPETLFGPIGGGGGNTDDQVQHQTGTFTISGAPVRHIHRTTHTGPHFRGGTTSFTIATGPVRPAGSPPGDFNAVFTNIIGNVGPPNFGDEQDRPAGLPPGFLVAIRSIIPTLLGGRGAAVQGDVVHSDEALDQIISMLMEANPPSGGPPPATQTAIDQLQRVKVDQKMLGSEGHAECTICISDVNLNEEVLLLPCKHWFHEECVVMWLKQHNTCPVCRHPVVADNAGAGNATHNDGSGNAGNNANRSGGGGGFFGGIPGLFGNMSSAAPGAASNAADSGTSGNQGGNGTRSGMATVISTAERMSETFSAAQRAQQERLQQERLDATRRRAVLTNNRYRSPRDAEQSASDRRRRDSHSPNPGPPFFTSWRYHVSSNNSSNNGNNSNVEETAGETYTSGSGGYGQTRDEMNTSVRNRTWRNTAYSTRSTAANSNNAGAGGSEPPRWDRGQGQEQSHDRARPSMSWRERERARGPMYGDLRPSGGAPSWMGSSRYAAFGGDGTHDDGGSGNASNNSRAGGANTAAAAAAVNPVGTGGFLNNLLRLGTGNGNSTTTPRRRP